MNDLSKRDRKAGGAVLFWEWFNQFEVQLKKMDSEILSLARSQQETKRRLVAIEQAVKTHSRIIFENQAMVRMFCISCHHEFDVPVAEAEDPNFTTVCPECHNWALPSPDESLRECSPKTIAEETGFSCGTVWQTIRELGLKHGREHQIYHQEEVEKIKAVLATKKHKPKKPGEEHK